MGKITRNHFKKSLVLLLFLIVPIFGFTQTDGPCDAIKWEDGAHWNNDGTIDDAPNSPDPGGIVRCGSSAETESNIMPNSEYNPSVFSIPNTLNCTDPDTGLPVMASGPEPGQEVTWFQFDIRELAGSSSFQVISNDNIAWALYYSNDPGKNYGPAPNFQTGDCSDLTFDSCGISFTGWADSPFKTPIFNQPTNYYLAVWDQDDNASTVDGFSFNFKARFGCGDDSSFVFCNLEAEEPTKTCNSDGTYTIEVPIMGANGEYVGFDPNATPTTSTAFCLTNIGSNPSVTAGTITMTYPQSVTNYNISIAAQSPPGGACADPDNPLECVATVTGAAPVCFVCPTLTNESADINTCIDDQGQMVSVDTDVDDIDIEFVWFSDPQTDPYTGGMPIGTAITPSGGMATSNAGINFATAGTYYVYAILDTADSDLTDPDCRPFSEIVIVIDEQLDPGADGTLAICEGEIVTEEELFASLGGTPDMGGEWTPVLAGAGIYTYTHAAVGNCPEVSATVEVTEEPALSAGENGTLAICEGEIVTEEELFASLGGTPDMGGEWTPVLAGAGIYTYTHAAVGNCPEVSATVEVTEEPALSAGDDNEISVCDGELIDLTTLVSVMGGSFSEAIITGGLDGTSFDTTGLSTGSYEIIYTVAGGDNCPEDTAILTINVDEPVTAGGDKELAICEGTIVDLNTLVDVAGGSFSPQGGGLSGSTLDTTGFAPGDYTYTYTIASNGTCPADTAMISIMISEDIIDKECKVIDADFCNPDEDPIYNFYWHEMREVSGTAFFSQDATHELVFTQFNNGTAIISGKTQQNGCTAELYIFLEDKKNWTQWTADGGTFKPQGCAGTIKEQMDYYVIDSSRSFITTTGDCVEEGTFNISQRPDPADMSTPNLGVHVGPGGALWDSNQGAEGLAGWAWMGPDGDEQRWIIDFNFLLDCEDKVGCIIDDPETLDCEIAATSLEDVDCNGGDNGSAIVTVSGGLPPYTYLWSNGETTMTAENLTAGEHTVTVTDSENTTTYCSVSIHQPELLECVVALDSGVSADGAMDGSATVSPDGGTENYTYLWDNGETEAMATALSAGDHMVTVTDSNGCTTTCSVTIPEAGMFSCTTDATDVLCYDGSDGTATVTPIGGLAPYTYAWSNGASTEMVSNLSAGSYSVTITDANGRETSCEVEVSQPASALGGDAIAFLNVSVYGGNDGVAMVTASGGTEPYTYLWSNGATTSRADDLTASDYSVVITDANGCTKESSVSIMQPDAPTPEICDGIDNNGDGTIDEGFADTDMDGIADCVDICDLGDDSVDTDGDGVPDACDVCASGDDSADADGDGVPDDCDICDLGDDGVDTDGDGVPDACDVCTVGDDSADADGDGVPDDCDICDMGDDSVDTDGDGTPDACDDCDANVDSDGDNVSDCDDICAAGDDSVDTDGDGVPDACDVCAAGDDSADADGDGVPDDCDICDLGDDRVDTDGDGIPDACDVCTVGDDSADADGDGVPDDCDICDLGDDSVDTDGDSVPDACDVCATGDDSADADGDGVPDNCDICATGDDSLDADSDGVPDACDICELGDDSADVDGDGVPDACDEEVCDGVDNDGDGDIDEDLNCDDTPPTGCETAFARYETANTCFIDDGFNRWGWTNYFETEGTYTMDLYAGAGQCNLNAGEKTGEVTVEYGNGMVNVSIDILSGFIMQETQLYVGADKYPTKGNGMPTVAPGQYPQNSGSLNNVTTYEFDAVDVSGINGGVYVIVHANTCENGISSKITQTTVTPYPMTFKDDLNLNVEIPYDAQLEIEIFDVNGRCIMTKKGMNVKVGSNNVHMNVSSLAPDVYFLIINTGRERITKKVMGIK